MGSILWNNTPKSRQYLISLLLVGLVSLVCFAFSAYLGYRVVALILLLTVSLIAVLFSIFPVLLSAVLSALIWNFLFIPPRFTLHVAETDDVILFVMYFVIALINAVLTHKIRQIEKVARQKEERANTVRLYNTLINSLSHELRTPIATIVAATDNLQANNENLTADDREELIGEISKASFRLNQQVENLLNMSRLESGFIKPKMDWTDINEVVYEVLKRVEENRITQKISVNINPGIPLFRLDKGMLEQVLYNLLNNATQYTGPDSTVYITVLGHIGVLEIIIEDNGPGFPENEIKKVFDKFYRLHHTKTGGTGLGLSIVKGFTEAMGGTVTLKNAPMGGARFTIVIPAPTAAATDETSYLKNLRHV